MKNEELRDFESLISRGASEYYDDGGFLGDTSAAERLNTMMTVVLLKLLHRQPLRGSLDLD